MRNHLRRQLPGALFLLALVIAAVLYGTGHQDGHGPSGPYTPPPTPTAAYPR